MWTRAQLKNKAKAALRVNYWKMVLVSLIITILVGGTGSAGVTNTLNDTETSDSNYEDGFNYGDGFGYEDDNYDELFGADYDELEDMIGDLTLDASSLFMFLSVFLVVFAIVMIIAIVVGLLMTAFIVNPIEVGCSKFFIKTLEKPAQVKEVAFAFDNSYKNVVKVMFFRTLYTMLWSLLFVIPGIIKGYEYRMIPYLMAENPNLTKEQAFALSKQMMMGQKWSAFVLDLSFIGWHLLSAITFGILEIFYVAPYVYATDAALYEELSSAYGRPAQNAYVTSQYQPAGAYQSVNPYERNNSYEAYYTAPVQEEAEQDAKNEE